MKLSNNIVIYQIDSCSPFSSISTSFHSLNPSFTLYFPHFLTKKNHNYSQIPIFYFFNWFTIGWMSRALSWSIHNAMENSRRTVFGFLKLYTWRKANKIYIFFISFEPAKLRIDTVENIVIEIISPTHFIITLKQSGSACMWISSPFLCFSGSFNLSSVVGLCYVKMMLNY